jgi:hypothetical protein
MTKERMLVGQCEVLFVKNSASDAISRLADRVCAPQVRSPTRAHR